MAIVLSMTKYIKMQKHIVKLMCIRVRIAIIISFPVQYSIELGNFFLPDSRERPLHS